MIYMDLYLNLQLSQLYKKIRWGIDLLIHISKGKHTKLVLIISHSDTIKSLRVLGFVIHPGKSVLNTDRTINFLGFIISSKDITLSLTDEKKNKMKTILSDCLCK